ncbi:MAG: hypothetical protein WEC75_09490 [Dehalococcoidia bacterium]
MNRIRPALAAALLSTSLLAAACGDAGAGATPTPPRPAATATPAPPPDPTAVAWDEAVQLIRDCRATMIMQAHSLDVWIDLDDGSRLTTKEPRIDLVFDVVSDAVANGCPQIPLATE